MKNKKILTGISFLLLLVLATQFSMIGNADESVIVRDFDRDRDRYQDNPCEDPDENNYNSTIIPPETNNGNDTCIPPGDGDQIRERDRIRDQIQDGTCNLTCICEQVQLREQDGSCIL